MAPFDMSSDMHCPAERLAVKQGLSISNVSQLPDVDLLELYSLRRKAHLKDEGVTMADWERAEVEVGDAFNTPAWLVTKLPALFVEERPTADRQLSPDTKAARVIVNEALPSFATLATSTSDLPAEVHRPISPAPASIPPSQRSSLSRSSFVSRMSGVVEEVTDFVQSVSARTAQVASNVASAVKQVVAKPLKKRLREKKQESRQARHKPPVVAVKAQSLPRVTTVKRNGDEASTTGTHWFNKEGKRRGPRGSRGGSRKKGREKLESRLLDQVEVSKVEACNLATVPMAASATQGTLKHDDAPAWPLTLGVKAYLRSFTQFPYDGRTLVLVDAFNRIFCIRSNVPDFMPSLHDEVVAVIEDFEKTVPSMPIDDNLVRGEHKYYIVGPHRQSSPTAFIIKWNRDNQPACDRLMRQRMPDGRRNPIRRLAGFINSVFQLYAPEVYAKMAAIPTQQLARQFDVFHQMCINAPGSRAKRVHCGVHVDQKNVPFFCAVWTYSKGLFNHRRRAWLVLWEAKVMLELPRAGVVLYPSALFSHFNVDIKDVEVRWTHEDEAGDMEWDEEADGTRGSIVFFTQGSMYQYAEHGMPLGEAQETWKDGKRLEPKGKEGNPARKAANMRLFDLHSNLPRAAVPSQE